MKKVEFKDFGVLLGIFVVIVVIQALGAYFTSTSLSTWYAGLVRPSWTPPNWLFGPVWSLLYVMMSVSVWFVYLSKKKGKGLCYFLFGMQMFFNFLWTIVFFRMENSLLGLIDILLIDIFLLITIVSFYRVSKPAAWLLVPYLCWVIYASTLNFGIYLLN
ncbi:MAG: Tryptophan-rich protein TspO [Chlamydiia bacterium]|nr:Tryptophan-rich protein TspO [Chlamydiia bacterium]MCH9619024.1 Tryptophan-rich protein TspO [Chlamydiia bacterium]MCH9624448.1 Tryptophan-rich protein TspO [Chlamydiia bacterium]